MIIPEHGRNQKPEIMPIIFCLLVIMFLFISGCVRPDTGFTVRPESFRQLPDVYANESTSEVTMAVGDTMLVSYPWTPEDGRYWRVSVTEGLFVTGDRYTPFPPGIPVEISGTREWMVRATSPGIQTFVGNLRPRATSWNQETIQQKITVTVLDEKNKST